MMNDKEKKSPFPDCSRKKLLLGTFISVTCVILYLFSSREFGMKEDVSYFESQHRQKPYVWEKGWAFYEKLIMAPERMNTTKHSNKFLMGKIIVEVKEGSTEEGRATFENANIARSWTSSEYEVNHSKIRPSGQKQVNLPIDLAKGQGHYDKDFINETMSKHVDKIQDKPLLLDKEGEVNPHDPPPKADILVYSLSQPITEEYDCVNLTVNPPTPICLYPSDEDVFVSKQIKKDGIWEGHIVKKFQEVLANDESLGVLDIGANLGLYCLVAATMGHPCVAVEPNINSIKRLHVAAKMADTEQNITVLQNAITDKRGTMQMIKNVDNQGDTRVGKLPAALETSAPGVHLNTSSNTVMSILLDDLLPMVNFKRAVLKLDTQGYEHKIFEHASRLLDEITVTHIFMEWVMMRDFYMTDSWISEDKTLVDKLVKMLTKRKYKVFSLVSGKKLDPRYWFGWPEDVLWVL